MSENTESIEDIIENDPQLAEAFQKAQLGEYEHTIFEIWEDILDGLIEATQGSISISDAHGLLTTWPWLRHKDLPLYFELRQHALGEIKDALTGAYSKPTEILFQEAEGDWEKHKQDYLEVIAQWTHMHSKWADEWAEIPFDARLKGIQHAVIADATALIAGPNSLPEQLRNLRDFTIDEKDGEWLTERLTALGVSDE